MAEHMDFERLERTVKTIATHIDYPGKQLLVRTRIWTPRGTLAQVQSGQARGRAPGGTAGIANVRARLRPALQSSPHGKVQVSPNNDRKTIGRSMRRLGHRRHDPARKGLQIRREQMHAVGLRLELNRRGSPAASDREGGAMMPQSSRGGDTTDREYLGLMRVADMIARHPDYPGKRVVVEECAEEIAERSLQGRLTPSQRD